LFGTTLQTSQPRADGSDERTVMYCDVVAIHDQTAKGESGSIAGVFHAMQDALTRMRQAQKHDPTVLLPSASEVESVRPAKAAKCVATSDNASAATLGMNIFVNEHVCQSVRSVYDSDTASA
jgi:N-acetylglucosamine-6-phosphate deacetylase